MPRVGLPWWAGAIALAAVFVLVRLRERRWLGVSGSFGRVVTPEEWSAERVRDRMSADPRGTEDALLRATLEHFGPEALSQQLPATDTTVPEPRAPLAQSVHVTFLLSLLAGGALSAILSGSWHWTTRLGDTFSHLIGAGWPAVLVLFLGGILTGVGTRMAGGCSSGHGITGCARLQAASLLSTAAFFGMGVLTSYLLQWGVR